MFGVKFARCRETIVLLIYVTLLLDNVLLTVIVPILPDFLLQQKQTAENNQSTNEIGDIDKESNKSKNILNMINLSTAATGALIKHTQFTGNSSSTVTELKNSDTTDFPARMKIIKFENENGSIALLLSIKAFIQLFCNPVIGAVTTHLGYKIPIFIGTLFIFVSAMIYGLGNYYTILFCARALHGIGSSCVSVCGMSLVAQLYPEEDKRSKIMGIVLGSIAFGVLIGYPFGGITYNFFNKSIPFYIIGGLVFFVVVFQFFLLNLNNIGYSISEVQPMNDNNNSNNKFWVLLMDKAVLLITFAIWISTSAMAILEPCLPIWLLTNLHPKKWELGTVFIPDSIGYLIGTNFLGSIAYHYGQIRISIIALFLVGISCFLIPLATTIFNLLLPHFGLGLGIGMLDASLVPLLAAIVDKKATIDEESDLCYFPYGVIYAIQQTAVSLAYSISPLLGGELTQLIGFEWLMRIIGGINVMYGFIFVYCTSKDKFKTEYPVVNILMGDMEIHQGDGHGYRTLYNSID